MVETTASARSSFRILKMFIMLRIFLCYFCFRVFYLEGVFSLKEILLFQKESPEKRVISDRIRKGISPQRSFQNTLLELSRDRQQTISLCSVLRGHSRYLGRGQRNFGNQTDSHFPYGRSSQEHHRHGRQQKECHMP